MSFQRVILNPLRRFTRVDQTPHDGIPPTWDREILPSLPDGQDWFEIHARPVAGEDYDPATQRIERVLDPITKRDGWQVIDLTPEEIAALDPVPQSVTRRQLLLALASLPNPITQKMIESQAEGNLLALIEIRNAGNFERNHPLTLTLAAAFNLSAAEVDELFRAASEFS